MCKRRKGRKPRKKVKKKTQRKQKKKLTCCQKCKRRIRLWLWRRLKRCVKRIIFGNPKPQLEELEVAGVNLDDVRDTFKKKSKASNKESSKERRNRTSVVTLFRNGNKSTKSIPMKDTLAFELDRYSLSKSLGNKIKSYVVDFKERNLYLGLSKDSMLKLNTSEKERFRKLAEEYEKKNKFPSQNQINQFRSIEKLKRKFSLTPSRTVLVKNMLEDYKTGKFSFSKIPDISKLNIDTFDKKDLNNVLTHYESQMKKKNVTDNISIKKQFRNVTGKIDSRTKKLKDLEFINRLSKAQLAKRFSLTGSKQKAIRNMMSEYKKGTFSISGIQNKLKTDTKEIDKEDLDKILDFYNVNKKKKRYSFIKQSRLKQLQSDLRAKIGFL